MSDVPRQLPPKKEVALHLLEEGPSLFVHLDPRRAGVQVPKWFTGQAQLVLQVGLNMSIPIPDLKVEEMGISCTLSFSRTPFWCRLPWSSIFALVGEDGLGMVWPEDVPPEVALQMQKQQKDGPAKPAPARKPRPKLAAVEPEPSEPRRIGRRDDAEPPKEPKRLEAVPIRPKRNHMPLPVPGGAARSDDASDEAPPPSARPAPSRPGKKPKRELPPYLRVIK